MGKSLIKVSPRMVERTLRTGVQLIPQPLEDSSQKGLYCKYGVRGECEGVNDLDYVRCSVLFCENCMVYQIKEQNADDNNQGSVLEDDVMVSGDFHNPEHISYDPIQDLQDDGRSVIERMSGMPSYERFWER